MLKKSRKTSGILAPSDTPINLCEWFVFLSLPKLIFILTLDIFTKASQISSEIASFLRVTSWLSCSWLCSTLAVIGAAWPICETSTSTRLTFWVWKMGVATWLDLAADYDFSGPWWPLMFKVSYFSYSYSSWNSFGSWSIRVAAASSMLAFSISSWCSSWISPWLRSLWPSALYVSFTSSLMAGAYFDPSAGFENILDGY